MRTLVIGILIALGAKAESANTSQVYKTADRPHALALIGDRYHSPVYIRDHLAPALLRENIPVTFIENVEADRKSTRLNSSHLVISYAVFCLKKKHEQNLIFQVA